MLRLAKLSSLSILKKVRQLSRIEKILTCFLPHPHTHRKAHLLSWHFLLIYLLLFVLMRLSFDLVNVYRPGVLGINSNITVLQIIDDTNKERQAKGLLPVRENLALDKAAEEKAKNMFEENYWAHFSPSGKDPWSFIRTAGYKFSYAGENLARNFYTAQDTVDAWMNSPSHRENLLNAHYQEIGLAVMEGTLQGQKTTLIVQMFGTPYQAVAAPPQVNLGGKSITVEGINDSIVPSSPLVVSQPSSMGVMGKALVDPYAVTKVAGIAVVSFIGLMLLADYFILRRRGVFRPSAHHLAHLSFLGLIVIGILVAKVGQIL